jgi:hypothetical protein
MERREDLPLLGFRRRKPKGVCPASHVVKQLCRDRASRRWSALLTHTMGGSMGGSMGRFMGGWSALLTQTKSGMRKRLGEINWAAFVRYAEAEHKDAFFRAFTPVSGVLRCEGKISGAPCPKAIRVDLCVTTSHECGDALPGLHLDHSYDAKHVCEVWSEALPDDPVSWDDGLCGALVAHLLFGVEGHVLAQCSTRPIWQPRLTFRCGDVKGVKGQHAAGFCHDVAGAHYKHVLEVKDLRWPSA